MGTGKKLFCSLVLAAVTTFCAGTSDFSSAWAHCRNGWGNGWGNNWGGGNSWGYQGRHHGYHHGYYNRYNQGGGILGNWFGNNNYQGGNRWANNYRGYGDWHPGLAYGPGRGYSRHHRGDW